MASSSWLPLSLLLFTLTVNIVISQITVGDNIFDSLDLLGCTHFKSIIATAHLAERYKYGSPATIFVFNDTTYGNLPPSRVSHLYDQTERGAKNYVQSFTLDRAVETSSFSSASPYLTEFNNEGYLFLNKRRLLSGNVASGTPGVTRYFVNGAVIATPNIKAGQHVIHIIDRVLEMPIQGNAISYAESVNPNTIEYKFYSELMLPLSRSLNHDPVINYSNQVRRVLMGKQVTFFMPSDQAISDIPLSKRRELIGDPNKLLQIITLHIIPSQVLYTSLVNHNERFNTQMEKGSVIFRKNFERESGALNGGGTVTARILPTNANITVRNGVVHQIDQLLGFVYRTAMEEIESTSQSSTNSFQSIVNVARADLKNALSASSGVTIFVPTDNAIIAISNVHENYQQNAPLMTKVLELSMLKSGQPFSLTNYNRGYRSMLKVVTRYNNRKLKIYSEGNDTWVEGGYVRARVIKPDIGVTNGYVHIIDAVFGIPTRDIVYTIFCNDWLMQTYNTMVTLQLDEYMRDPDLVKNQQCSFLSGESGSPAGVPNRYSRDLCGRGEVRCQFTYFVPNGTAIDNFSRMPAGRHIMQDPKRYRWLLRRLMTRKKLIYIDELAPGALHRYIADNGEEVYIQVNGRSQDINSWMSAFIMFDNVRADIIRSDIGATNGVIHIIDDILFVQDDLHRDVSKASSYHISIITLFSLAIMSMLLVKS